MNTFSPITFCSRIFVGGLAAIGFFVPTFAHAQQVSLPATFHRQEHSLSCEVAALKIALNIHGITVEENELISRLPFDPTPKSSGIWGDPNKGFVGSIDGRMLVTGYGVYWDPIAKLGAQYTPTQVIRHSSAAQLAQEIANGNPVIIWSYYGKRASYSWHTPSGTPIKAIGGEHTIVAYGFDGPIAAPTRFYLMDPANKTITWSTDELMYNWGSLDNMGVVVKAQTQWVRLPNDTEIWELNHRTKTRRLIATWQAFTARGGKATAVKNIDKSTLLTYINTSPINE